MDDATRLQWAQCWGVMQLDRETVPDTFSPPFLLHLNEPNALRSCPQGLQVELPNAAPQPLPEAGAR